MAGFEKWEDVLNLPKLNDLLQIRRPKRVSEAIATAVYRRHLYEGERQNNPQAALDQAKSLGRFQPLVRSTESFHSRDAIKFAVLSALASDPPNRDRAEQLLGRFVAEEDKAWCLAVAGLVPKPTSSAPETETLTPFDLAESYYHQGDFDAAFQLYLTVPPKMASVCRVLETGVEMDSIHAGEQAIDYLNQASEKVRAAVLARRNCTNQVEALKRLLTERNEGHLKSIDSWESWFEFVDQSDDLGNAQAILDHGRREWLSASGDLVSTDAARIAELIKKPRSGHAAEVIRNAAPVLIAVFLGDGSANREHRPIHRALIELLIYDDAIGPDDLIAVEQLLEAILTTPSQGSAENDFAFAVNVVDLLWSNSSSPRNLDWALSLLDLLIDTGAQQHTDLTPLLSSIVNSLSAWLRRVRDDQWHLLELLASDLHLTEMVAGLRPASESETERDTPSLHTRLVGKSIAVYSITERIARRFGQMAEQTFEGIKLHYLHDKSLTDRMKSLAQSADIFIVNTWDAKHAATNGIKDNRPADAVTLEPEGKSASALMRQLHAYALETA